MPEKGCDCKEGVTLVFACSGAADVGKVADEAARKLTADGAGKMFCLAGVGGTVEPIMETTRAAARILAIDGCAADCAKSCLEQAGFTEFEHMRVTDCGFEKGSAPPTAEAVAKVADEAAGLITCC